MNDLIFFYVKVWDLIKCFFLVLNMIIMLSKCVWKFKLNFFIMLKLKWLEYLFLVCIVLLLFFSVNNIFKILIIKVKVFVGKKYLNGIGSFLNFVFFKFLMVWMFWKRVFKYVLVLLIVDIFLLVFIVMF